MKRSRFTTEQIIAILQEHRAGTKAEDLGRRHGFSPGTLYVWKQRLATWSSAMPSAWPPSNRRMPRLKRLVADQALNVQILKDVLGKGR